MTVQDLQKTIADLEKILRNTSGMDKIELNDTIFELKNKLANLITSPLDDLNVNISQNDLDKLTQAAANVENTSNSAQQKASMVKQAIGIGKTILSFF